MTKTIKSLLLVITAMLIVFITGCQIEKLELTTENKSNKIMQGESVQLVVNDSGTVTYEVTEGKATVNDKGLLTCSEEAEVGSRIVVTASSSLGVAKVTLTVEACKVKEIELSADSETIKKGQQVALSVELIPSHALVEGVTYEITEGSDVAEVVEGKVQIKEVVDQADAIGQTITVVATTVDTKVSDSVSITVIEALVEEVILKVDNSSLSYGKVVTFNVSYIPGFAGTNAECALEVVEGAELVELNGNNLSIKEGLTEEQIVGNTVKVRATLVSNSEIYSEVEINLVEAEQINIIVSDKTFIAGENAVETLLPEAYDSSYNLLDLNANDFTYESSNESVVKVGANTGVLTAVGHGQAEITVRYRNSSTVCNVAVIVVPENIEFTDLNTHILTSRKYYYSNVEQLELAFQIDENEAYQTTASKVTYTFELLDAEGNVVKSGEEVATVENGKISFKVTGDVKVTVTTDSSLNGKNTASHEKYASLVVSVNDGVNIRTVDDMKRYQADEFNGKAANFINTIKLDAEHNFGFNDTLNYNTYYLAGNRYLNGNGYAIDLMDLPLCQSASNGTDLIRIFVDGSTNKHTAEIRDLEFIGNYNLNRQYVGNVAADQGKDAIKGSYNRAIRIGANKNYGYGICENLVISNVKVSGFNVGLRIEHTVNSYVSDINISQCTTNGIELNQNIITLNNIYVGQVGAFAFEMVPDDMVKEADGTLHGTAGYNFDQTPETKLTGSISSTNFNNGKSTAYMSSLQLSGYTIPEILMMIVAQKIQYAAQVASAQTGMTVEECQAYLANLAYRCLFKDADPKQGLMNFFLLVFIDPTDERFAGYAAGNKQNVFGTYTSDEVDGNVISIDKVLTDAVATLIAGGSYDAYKNYKYVLMDLDLTSALGVNLGEVIVVNEYYNK